MRALRRGVPSIRDRPLARVAPTLAVLAIACGPRPPSVELDRLWTPASGLNVVVVSFDALRADRLGVYGYDRPTSPRIDAFAREALVFDRAYSAAHATPTSFAAAFSGRWPSRVFRSWRFAAPTTLASTFRAAGYRTAFLSGSVQLVEQRGFATGFDDFEILLPDDGSDRDHDGIVDDERLLERARRWLAYEWTEPFLLWIHFFTPHAPYTERPLAAELYRSPRAGRFELSTGLRFDVATEGELARVQDLYDGEVRFADALFASILDILARQAFLESSIVVLTADHGEELLDHGALQHGQMFEEIVRVPLLIRHPHDPIGTRTRALYSNVDLLPTLAALVDVPVEGEFDGRSLAGQADARRVILSLAMTGPEELRLAAIRGDQKAILDCATDRASLFDLASDPGERHDLATQRRRELRGLLAEADSMLGEEPCSALRSAMGGRPDAALSGEQAAKLAALGYLGAPADPPPRPRSAARLRATPNPIPVCDGLPLGATTLDWWVEGGPRTLEIHVDSADGPLFARGGIAGRARTDRWVRDGLRFVLVDRADGRVLDQVAVRLTSEGCDAANRSPPVR